MAKVVCPFGYGPDIAKGYKHLDEQMSIPKTVLIDIRLKPYSTFPAWNGASLEAHYGKKRYIWLDALGNLNHKEEDRHKGFALKDTRAGLDRLQQGLDKGYRLILLCGCRDYNYCHRKLVVQLLAAEVEGLIVQHPGEKTTKLILLDEPIDIVTQPLFEQPALLDVPVEAQYRHFDQG